MGEQGCLIMDDLSTCYSGPQVEDYGTLTALTEGFDPDTLASVAKGAMSLAVVSTLVPGSGILPGSESGGGGGGGGGTPGSGTLGENRSGGGGSTPGSGGDDSGTAGTRGSGGSGGGEALGAGAGAGGGGGGSGSGGRLPFSGFDVVLIAAVGTALTGAGARARSALRRKRD